jgi:hypothetical protein
MVNLYVTMKFIDLNLSFTTVSIIMLIKFQVIERMISMATHYRGLAADAPPPWIRVWAVPHHNFVHHLQYLVPEVS